MTLQQAMTKAWDTHFKFLKRGKNTTVYHIASLTRKRPQSLLHGGVLLSDIGQAEIADYVARRRGETRGQWRETGKRKDAGQLISATTINDELTTLATCLTLAKSWKVDGMQVGISDVNIREYRLPETQHVHTDLPDDLVDTFIDNLAPHATAPICMYLYTGLRKSNIIGTPGLWWQTLSLYTERPHARVKIKGEKMHTVWLPNEAVWLLEFTQPNPAKRHGPVFRFGNDQYPCDCLACKKRKGDPILSIRRTVNTARKAIGIPDLNLHDLRHKVGRILVRKYGLKVAQQALGHSDIKTTAKFYGDQEQAFIAEAVNKSLGSLTRIRHAAKKEEAG